MSYGRLGQSRNIPYHSCVGTLTSTATSSAKYVIAQRDKWYSSFLACFANLPDSFQKIKSCVYISPWPLTPPFFPQGCLAVITNRATLLPLYILEAHRYMFKHGCFRDDAPAPEASHRMHLTLKAPNRSWLPLYLYP